MEMKQWKNSLKLLKYSFGLKMNLAMVAFFLAAGLVLEMVGLLTGEIMGLGSVYVQLAAMMPAQIWIMFAVSQIVSVSPWRKQAHTIIPTAIMAVLNLFGYTVLVIMKLVVMAVKDMDPMVMTQNIFLQSISLLILMVYFSVCYKSFVAATIGFLVVFIPFMSLLMRGLPEELTGMMNVLLGNIPLTILASYVIIFIGIAISYGISLLLANKDFSKFAMGARMRKYL